MKITAANLIRRRVIALTRPDALRGTMMTSDQRVADVTPVGLVQRARERVSGTRHLCSELHEIPDPTNMDMPICAMVSDPLHFPLLEASVPVFIILVREQIPELLQALPLGNPGPPSTMKLDAANHCVGHLLTQLCCGRNWELAREPPRRKSAQHTLGWCDNTTQTHL